MTQAGYGPVQAYWDVSGPEAVLNNYSEITAFSNFSNLEILNLLVKKILLPKQTQVRVEKSRETGIKVTQKIHERNEMLPVLFVGIRAVANGGASGAWPPQIKSVPSILRLAPRLLHTSKVKVRSKMPRSNNGDLN